MPARLPRITAFELMRALERDGWYVTRQEGSHARLKHPSKPGRVTVVLHRAQTINPKTLRSALQQAGLTPDELHRLL
jgi:predicted RNA binding protein YcfA (HicA-like mRNA interferase family)